jgi:alginate O-acetyltransferase complex protein AlgI
LRLSTACGGTVLRTVDKLLYRKNALRFLVELRYNNSMVFADFSFLFLYLPCVLLVYYLCPKKARNLFLLVSGAVFYAWGEPRYVFLMLFSTAVDYLLGLYMARQDAHSELQPDTKLSNDKRRFIALIASVVVNIGVLALFKYSVFVFELLHLPTGGLPHHLPIGISFYTFQSMSYTIDLYRRNIKPQKNAVSFAAFVTMFPQIVAGPIVRYEQVAKELAHRKTTLDMFSSGISLFIIGLGKKVLLANNVGALWTQIKAVSPSELSVASAWLGIIAFTLQIYFDFSGYSDMAVGLGKMLGFNFPRNFNYPYISRSISEFWRRWHITLGEWFKSYVYFPLGGSRNSDNKRVNALKTIRNLAVVWLLTGLWHGANLTFLVWGGFYGAIIILEHLGWGRILQKLPRILTSAYTLLLVMVGWAIFEAASLHGAVEFIGAMFGVSEGGFTDDTARYALLNYARIIIVCTVAATPLSAKLWDVLQRNRVTARISAWVALPLQFAVLAMCAMYLTGADYNPFLYFNF